MKAPRALQLRVLAELITELTLLARYRYAEGESADRMLEVNDAIHRVAGHLQHIVDPGAPLVASRAVGLIEQMGHLPDQARSRIAGLL
ncbi:hypothetical protein [Phenylobacterium sp.]|uniref:hypothetical protein n=1 Tax=Phenylobacterium sp. TaxID=1871053 RepID=UPI002FC5EA58